MNHLKMLSFVVMATAGLMVFASSAAATPVLTSPAGNEYTGSLEATANSSLLLKAGFANFTCLASTIAGSVTTNNSTHAAEAITTLTFSNCGATTVNTITKGSLTVAPGGTVSGSGSEITFSVFGSSCIYGTKTGTILGTLTGGSPAKMEFAANLPLVSGGFGCANPATLTGGYTFTKPNPLWID